MTFKPGDLVMVVKPRPCCGESSSMGKIFTVIREFCIHGYCPHCGAIYNEEYVVEHGNGGRCQTSRLRLIPPLSDPQEIVREVETV